MMRKKSTDLIT